MRIQFQRKQDKHVWLRECMSSSALDISSSTQLFAFTSSVFLIILHIRVVAKKKVQSKPEYVLYWMRQQPSSVMTAAAGSRLKTSRL